MVLTENGRIKKARQKIAKAIIDGLELNITGGNFELINSLHHCLDCGDTVQQPLYDKINQCHECGSNNINNLAVPFLKESHLISAQNKKDKK